MEAVNRRASGSPPVLAVGLELAHSLAQPCVLYDSLLLGLFHFKFVLRFVKTLQLLRPILPVVDCFQRVVHQLLRVEILLDAASCGQRASEVLQCLRAHIELSQSLCR
jgi:hypothetical protein